MRNLIILLFVILLSNNNLQAQINKEVEVTKAYVPTVQKAEKPQLKAVIVDTAYISPDIDYSITPLSITTPLQTRPIKPATVTYWEFNRSAMSQVKVGAGYPLNTLLQASVSTQNKSVGYLAANVDHSGNYSDIKNFAGENVDATQVLNNLALSGGLYIGRRTLDGSISYSNDIYHNYAYQQLKSPYINYQDFSAALHFGDKFVDLSKLNYSISSEYSYFTDKANNSNTLANFSALLGRKFDLGKMLLGVDYQGVSNGVSCGNQSMSAYLNLDKQISSWLVNLGVKYYHESTTLESITRSHNYVIPVLLLKKAAATTIAPFAEIGGRVVGNSYRELAEINPFVAPGLFTESSVEYNFKGGVMGQLFSNKLSYHLYFGYDIAINNRYWGLKIIEVGDNNSDKVYFSYFDMDLSGLSTSSMNIDVDYMPHANWTLGFDAHVYGYNVSNSAKYLNSRPDYDLSLNVDYTHRDFRFGVRTKVLGQRSSSVERYSPSSSEAQVSIARLPVCIDLCSYVDWQFSPSVSIFVEGSNLCNSNLYPWALYRGFGAQVTAGVKLNFR